MSSPETIIYQTNPLRIEKDSWEGKFDATRTVKSKKALGTSALISKKKKLRIGVLSWNIGNNNNNNKLTDLMKTFLNVLSSKPDILIIGFQEIPVKIASDFHEVYNEIDTIFQNILKAHHYSSVDKANRNNNEESHDMFTCVGKLSSVAGGFGITTFLYKKEDLNIKIINVVNFCEQINIGLTNFDGIKGFNASTILVNDLVHIDIINTHMPFESMEITESAITNMKTVLKSEKMDSSTQIILGDLNSRSLLTSECYKKDVNNCKSKKNYEKMCKIKSFLENLNLEDSVSLEPSSSNIRMIPLKKTSGNNNQPFSNCSIEERVSKKRLTNDELNNFQTTKKDIIRMLLKSDSLLQNIGTWFPGFKEKTIQFLPSYKRNIRTGLFLLDKNSKGRLPGYADRILIKNKLLTNMVNYQLLPINGNDHVPLMGEFVLSINILDKHTGTRRKKSPFIIQDNKEILKKPETKMTTRAKNTIKNTAKKTFNILTRNKEKKGGSSYTRKRR